MPTGVEDNFLNSLTACIYGFVMNASNDVSAGAKMSSNDRFENVCKKTSRPGKITGRPFGVYSLTAFLIL
jgi:hypothetical protein